MEKVRVELKSGDTITEQKGQYTPENNTILVRTWYRLRPVSNAYLVLTPDHFKLWRTRRGTIRTIKINQIDGRSYPYDDRGLPNPTSAETTTAVRLLGNQKLWKALGGRPLDRIETAIYLLAGYGLGRWAENTLIRIFAPT